MGGLQQPPRPEREGVAAKLNKFSFSYFSFVITMDYVPKILET